jgi:hypothetical protein
MNYYSSEEWGTKANSTERLLITNFQAISCLIEKGFMIDQLCVSEKEIGILEKILDYDLIVINQTAGKKQHAITSKIIDFAIEKSISEKIVFGTEVTWFLEASKGTYRQDQIDFVYSKSRLLRHTAKTDRPIYANNICSENIIEFEIGLDCDLIKPISCITQRNLVTFVCAPPGRVTKNNALIEQIELKIKSCDALNYLEICKVIPPYRSTDLWQIYEKTKYLIFTSDGETFSYVLNDAKAKGCITFFPDHMYDNNISGKFTVVSYPDSGIRYFSVGDLVEKLMHFEFDHKAALRESNISREYVVNNFSVQKIKRNWERLFLGKNLNENVCYIYNSDFEEFESRQGFVKYLNKHNIRFVMVVKDEKSVIPEFLSFSFYDSFNDIIYHRYLYKMHGNGNLSRNVALDPESKIYKYSMDGQSILKENEIEVRQFFKLFKRINKIRSFVAKLEVCKNFNSKLNIDFNCSSDLEPICQAP